jgi:diguanylate cyclase (GGDEF)-like protein
VLADLDIIDRPRTAEFEALARLAAFVCGTPTAAVNLIDRDRQWQAAAYGVAPGQVAREDSMCSHSIRSAGVTYVPDASVHELFRTNPFVTGVVGQVRLYAAAPLVVAEQPVGTLCAFAEEPRQLSEEQLGRLQDLAFAAGQFLELRRTAGVLARTALRDDLTGLHSRVVFREALERAFARRDRALTEPGLVFVDLNAFKPVNDTYGHAAGDTVLREVARRLEDVVRATDLAIRLGGDEFVVLLEEVPYVEDAATSVARIAERIAEAVARPITLAGGQTVCVSASVGWAVALDGESPDAMVARADAAMYAEKVGASR